MGLKVTILTSDDRRSTEEIIRKMGLEDLVAASVCGDDGFPGKPDPRGIMHICDTVGVEPGECWMVGDTGADTGVAAEGGLAASVGVLSGVSSEESHFKPSPTFVADTVASVPDMVQAYNERVYEIAALEDEGSTARRPRSPSM